MLILQHYFAIRDLETAHSYLINNFREFPERLE